VRLSKPLVIAATVLLALCPAPWAAAAPATAPAFLTAVVVPGKVPAGGSTGAALYLEVVNAIGTATTLAQNLPVDLHTQTGSHLDLPASVTIPAGSSAVRVPLSSPLLAGTFTVDAQAPGMPAAHAEVDAVKSAGPGSGAELNLALSPAGFFSGGRGAGWATVILEDGKGAPAVATSPISVALVSSNPRALAVPATVTVPAGAFSVSAPVQVGAPAAVSVTALASGYLSSTVKTTVFGRGGGPVALKVTAMPDVILPGSRVQFVVQAIDDREVPVPFPCGTLVLASATPDVLSLPRTTTPTCAAGQQAVVVDADPGGAPGTASITVAESGLVSADVKITASGAAPVALSATVAPEAIMFGQSHAGWLVLQPLDSKGQPVSAIGPVTVTLAGPSGLVPQTVTIEPGQNAVAVRLGRLTAGTDAIVQITAPGLGASTVDFAALAGRGAPNQSQGIALHLGSLRIPIGWLLGALLAITGALLLVLLRGDGRRGHRAL
jgi:hypothetical protein